MNFWDFAAEHYVVLICLVLAIGYSISNIISSITGKSACDCNNGIKISYREE